MHIPKDHISAEYEYPLFIITSGAVYHAVPYLEKVLLVYNFLEQPKSINLKSPYKIIY